MARPNRERTLEVEPILAARIQREREDRGLTYEALAKRMTDLGCPIQASAIQKIEKSGRRIVVDEAMAFSLAFDIPVAELLTPAWIHHSLQMKTDLLTGPQDRFSIIHRQEQYSELLHRVAAYLVANGLDNELWAAFDENATQNARAIGEEDSLSWAFRTDVLKVYEESLKLGDQGAPSPRATVGADSDG